MKVGGRNHSEGWISGLGDWEHDRILQGQKHQRGLVCVYRERRIAVLNRAKLRYISKQQEDL